MPEGAWFRRSSTPAVVTSLCRCTAAIDDDLVKCSAAGGTYSYTGRATIVHARSRAPAWSASLACRRTGAHFVTTYHGTYNEDLPFKRRYNSVMAHGERVIVASRFIADLINRQHGTTPAGPDHSTRVDPDGVRSKRGRGSSGGAAGTGLAVARQGFGRAAARAVDELEGTGGADRGADAPVRPQCVCVLVEGLDQGRQRYSAGLIRQAESGWALPTGCVWWVSAMICQRRCCWPTWSSMPRRSRKRSAAW